MNAFITRKISVLHNKKYRKDKKTINMLIKSARKQGQFCVTAYRLDVSYADAIIKYLRQKKFDVKLIYLDSTGADRVKPLFQFEISW